jgi:hypothetical protein
MVNHNAVAGLSVLLSISVCGTLGASYFAATHPGIYAIPRSNAVGCRARPISCCAHNTMFDNRARVACIVENTYWPV